MKPTTIDGANMTLGAPKNWKPGDLPVADLAIRAEQMFEGVQMMSSAWSPDPDELERIEEGAPIILTVIGSNHPVVAVSVGQTPKAEPTPLEALALLYKAISERDKTGIGGLQKAVFVAENVLTKTGMIAAVDNRADKLAIVR